MAHFLIEKLFEGAKKEGADCEEITLAELKINICKGCSVCNTEKHLLKCIYEENEQKEIVAEFVHEILDIPINIEESIDSHSVYDKPAARFIQEFVSVIGPKFKNASFREEQEWRIVNSPQQIGIPSFSECFKTEVGPKLSCSGVMIT